MSDVDASGVEAEWIRRELARHGIAVGDDDVEAVRSTLARTRAVLTALRADVNELEEPGFAFRLDERRHDVGGGER